MVKLLDPNHSYTFSKIFDLKILADELANEFGYSYTRKKLQLAQYSGTLDRLDETRSRIEEILPYVDLANETLRRKILISRVVIEVIHYTKAQLRIEYPIKVTSHLQGCLDYLMRLTTDLLVIGLNHFLFRLQLFLHSIEGFAGIIEHLSGCHSGLTQLSFELFHGHLC